jgi:hypothetical protein
MDTHKRQEITSLMRSDKRESEPGQKKLSKPSTTRYTGLSRKQVTVGKTTFRKGVRRAEVKGVAKYANRVLGYVVYDDKGKVWRFQKPEWERLSVEAHRTRGGAVLLMCAQL